jgi:hypothetical protein
MRGAEQISNVGNINIIQSASGTIGPKGRQSGSNRIFGIFLLLQTVICNRYGAVLEMEFWIFPLVTNRDL